MSKIKLCFGVLVPAPQWARVIGVKYGEVKSKKCNFCGMKSDPKNNFCGNCGMDIRKDVSSIGPAEIIEITLAKGMVPPRPLQIMALKNDVCVCQVLGEGDGGVAEFSIHPGHAPWDSISNLIMGYLPLDVKSQPKLMAMSVPQL